jgi:hypothetical protein
MLSCQRLAWDSMDPHTSSWIAYAGGRYEAAARGFSKLVRSDSVKHARVR